MLALVLLLSYTGPTYGEILKKTRPWYRVVPKPSIVLPSRDTIKDVISRHTRPLENDKVAFVHISKNGGGSVITHLRDWLNPELIFPPKINGFEQGLPYIKKRHLDSSLLVTIRSPRSHFRSLFRECMYDPWGATMIANPNSSVQDKLWFSNHRNQSYPQALTAWAKYFVGGHPPGYVKSIGCYHPYNYQSRALSVDSRNAHMVYFSQKQLNGQIACPIEYAKAHLCDKSNSHVLLRPNASLALNHLLSVDWFGIIEFYHASICLLGVRLRNTNDWTRDNKRTEYIKKECVCPTSKTPIAGLRKGRQSGQNISSSTMTKQDRSLRDIIIHHYNHSKLVSSSTQVGDNDLLAMVDAMTGVDQAVFLVALKIFLFEVALIESRINHRFLCDDVLEESRKSFSHLNINVVSIYNLSVQMIEAGYSDSASLYTYITI